MAGSRENPDAAAFRRIFEALFDDLVRFVERRTDEAAVDDVVADTFLVAWRRFAELPSDSADVRPWLFAVARRVLANTYRGQRRARDLAVRIAAQPRHGPDDDAAALAHRLDLARAFERLGVRDQEALALVAWDGLSPTEAALVLDIGGITAALVITLAIWAGPDPARFLNFLGVGEPVPALGWVLAGAVTVAYLGLRALGATERARHRVRGLLVPNPRRTRHDR